jgi:hypothetical protein
MARGLSQKRGPNREHQTSCFSLPCGVRRQYSFRPDSCPASSAFVQRNRLRHRTRSSPRPEVRPGRQSLCRGSRNRRNCLNRKRLSQHSSSPTYRFLPRRQHRAHLEAGQVRQPHHSCLRISIHTRRPRRPSRGSRHRFSQRHPLRCHGWRRLLPRQRLVTQHPRPRRHQIRFMESHR